MHPVEKINQRSKDNSHAYEFNNLSISRKKLFECIENCRLESQRNSPNDPMIGGHPI